MVDKVLTWDDNDNTAIGAIDILLKRYKNSEIIFANGGDRNQNNIPELDYFKNIKNITFKFGVGGDKKINSSSKILKDWIS